MTKIEKATFGAGCFWKQDEFDNIDGIISTTVGYMGGDVKDPSYDQVCTDTTGHVEVVQIEFDSDEITYEELLEIFWKIHDPTTPNQDGPNIGKHYKSVVFYHSKEQKKIVEESLKKHQEINNKKIITEIKKYEEFYKAEEQHQNFNKKNKLF